MPLANGEVFAGYTILRLLGSGGMGEVYLAEHPRLPRREALKVLGNDVSAEDDYRRRFISDASAVATLSHPHLINVRNYGESEGRLWMSMEYVVGTDTARLIRDRYPVGMPVSEALAVVTAIADALDYVHEHGLIHGDVNPANILAADGEGGGQRILLTAFGIGHLLCGSLRHTAMHRRKYRKRLTE